MITLLTVLVLFVAVPIFVGYRIHTEDPIPDMKRILDCQSIDPFTGERR
jgi:hypothetical protein